MDGDTRPNSHPELVTEDDFRIKGSATRSTSPPVPRGQAKEIEACTICLSPITERAVAAPCNHLSFDFICLASWLQERATCPLCNAAVKRVEYDWRSPQDYKTYIVPAPRTKILRPSNNSHRRETWLERPIRQRRRPHERWTVDHEVAAMRANDDPALERRRRVYRDRTYTLHVGMNRISQYRDFTPDSFAASPELQTRARMFLRRELKVFSFLDAASAPRGGNRDSLIEYIVAVLKTNEIKDASGHAEELLAEFVGRENAQLLLHELAAWLRSPYERLEAWDAHAQYFIVPGEFKREQTM